MKKTFYITLILGVIFSWYGCYLTRPLKETINNFSYCYTDKTTGLDSIISTNGYYSMSLMFRENNTLKHNRMVNCLFYEDGFFIYRFDTLYKDGAIGAYGNYIVCNDTIKAQYIYNPLSVSNGIHEVWFKITAKNKIKWLYAKAWSRITDNDIKEFRNKKCPNIYIDTAQFIPLKELPNTDKFWIKRQRFFWCDEEKYKEFKAKIKREKIKKYNDFKHR